MRKLLCILYGMNVLWCTAQEQPASTKLNKNAVVLDSNGVQYPYAVWQKKMESGGYGVRHRKGDSIFTLRKLTEAQISKRDSSRLVREEKMTKPADSKFFTTGSEIALDDKYAIREFLKTTPYNYHIVDYGGFIAERQYGIQLYPTNVVIDKNGNVQFHTSGYQGNLVMWLRATIDKWLLTN